MMADVELSQRRLRLRLGSWPKYLSWRSALDKGRDGLKLRHGANSQLRGNGENKSRGFVRSESKSKSKSKYELAEGVEAQH